MAQWRRQDLLRGAKAGNYALTADFCHIGTKRSVPWPSKDAKIRFRPGLCHGHTPLGELKVTTLLRTQSAGEGTAFPIPRTRHQPTFGARSMHMVTACVVPDFAVHSAQCTVAQTCQLCCSILHLVNIR